MSVVVQELPHPWVLWLRHHVWMTKPPKFMSLDNEYIVLNLFDTVYIDIYI